MQNACKSLRHLYFWDRFEFILNLQTDQRTFLCLLHAEGYQWCVLDEWAAFLNFTEVLFQTHDTSGNGKWLSCVRHYQYLSVAN